MATPNFNFPPDVEPGTGMGMGISPGRSTEPEKLSADIWSIVAEYLPEEDQIKLRTLEGASRATEASLSRERVKTLAEIEKEYTDLKKDLVPFLETVINYLIQIKNPNAGRLYNPTPEDLSLYKDQIVKLKVLINDIKFRKPMDFRHLKSSFNEFNNRFIEILDRVQPEHLISLNFENMPPSLSKIKDTFLLMNEIKTALETRAFLDEKKALYDRAVALEVPFLAELISINPYYEDLPELMKLWASIGRVNQVNLLSQYVSSHRNSEQRERIKGATIAGYILRGNYKDTILSNNFKTDPFIEKNEIYLNMIKNYLANNQPEEAWRFVKEVGKDYSDSEGITDIFDYYFLKDPQSGIQFFNQIDEKDESLSYARYQVASKIMDYYLEQEKSEEKAIQLMEKMFPDYELSLTLVNYYLKNEKYDKALQLAENIQRLTPERGFQEDSANNFRAILDHFLKKNMIEEAAITLKKAIYTFDFRKQTDRLFSELLNANKFEAALDLINEAPYFKNGTEASYRAACYDKVMFKCLVTNEHDRAIEMVPKLPENIQKEWYKRIYNDYISKQNDWAKKSAFREKLLKLTDDLPREGF